MPESIKKILAGKDKKKLFVGIGNLLRIDDGVGVYISTRINPAPGISILTVEASIENYIGKINSLKPDILILVDAVDMGAIPGTYKLLSVNQVQDLTFNTHNISLKRLAEFFKMKVFILGIQPEKIDIGENISYLVKNEADKIIEIINNH